MNEPATALPRIVIPVLVGVALIVSAMTIGHFLQPALNRPLQALRIDGELHRLSAAQIAEAARGGTKSALFDVDLDAVRSRIEALPWVAHARVSRVWPDRIAIRVQERLPYAHWREGSLIDSESHVFTPPAALLPTDLPTLSAPDGHEAETAATFQGLRNALEHSAFVPTGLTLDIRGEWRLATARGIELRLGQGDPLTRTALLLGAVSHTLRDQIDSVAYIDLRYSNGFAVALKDGTTRPPVAVTKQAATPTAKDDQR